MSGEDPWDPGPWTSNFRVKCPECGRQIQFANGGRVGPDCGHDLDSVRIEMGDEAEPMAPDTTAFGFAR